MRTRSQLGRDKRDKLIAVVIGLALVAVLCWQQSAVHASSQQILAEYFTNPGQLEIISDSGTGPFSFGMKFHQIQFTGPENLAPKDPDQFALVTRASLSERLIGLLPDELARDTREARYHIWLHTPNANSSNEAVAIVQDKATKSYWLLNEDGR